MSILFLWEKKNSNLLKNSSPYFVNNTISVIYIDIVEMSVPHFVFCYSK